MFDDPDVVLHHVTIPASRMPDDELFEQQEVLDGPLINMQDRSYWNAWNKAVADEIKKRGLIL